MQSEIMNDLKQGVDEFMKLGPIAVSSPAVKYRAIKSARNMSYREYLSSYKDIVKSYKSNIVIVPPNGYYADLLNTLSSCSLTLDTSKINYMVSAITRMKQATADVDFI